MSRVVTVTGHVDAADLDFTLVHEHVVAASPGVLTSWPELHGGRAAVAQRGTQATAPLYRLPARGFLKGFYWRTEFSLVGGRILHDYLGADPS